MHYYLLLLDMAISMYMFIFFSLLNCNSSLDFVAQFWMPLISLCSGHGSFSNNAKLNSVVGHLLHSSILVPYHGWYALDLKIFLFSICICNLI